MIILTSLKIKERLYLS